jgi:hypothetical protein
MKAAFQWARFVVSKPRAAKSPERKASLRTVSAAGAVPAKTTISNSDNAAVNSL